MPEELDTLVDELYGLPLERFVPERDLLARRLRAEGRRDEAVRVAALTKPSVVAWAVNQVVRSRRDEARALWEAGDAVVDAQRRLIEGEGSGAELREAVDAERAALAPLAEAARGLVTASGKFLGEQNVQVLVETLHAAAVDPGLRPDVEAGRLTRPVQLAGLGDAPAPEVEAEAQRRRIERRERADAADEVDRRRRAREERARKQAAQRALVRAERERDKARDRIGAAVRARDEAAGRVAEARRALEAAELGLAKAEEDLASAHEELERAEEAVDVAREDLGAA